MGANCNGGDDTSDEGVGADELEMAIPGLHTKMGWRRMPIEQKQGNETMLIGWASAII